MADEIEKSEAGAREPTLADKIAAQIRHLHATQDRGALAELRRMDPENPVVPAFQRILSQVAADAGFEWARRLALATKIAAMPMGADALTARPTLGELMRTEKFPEGRLQKLMTARGSALDDQILRLARRLARTGSMPWRELVELALARGPDRLERLRYRIAREYWKYQKTEKT
jgi:hypothetical protein